VTCRALDAVITFEGVNRLAAVTSGDHHCEEMGRSTGAAHTSMLDTALIQGISSGLESELL